MEQPAEPGKAYLTEHTANLVESWFELDELDDFKLAGVRDAVHVHPLQAALAADVRRSAVCLASGRDAIIRAP